MNTKQWRSLSGIAVKAYVVIAGNLYDGTNNGRLMASARWLANDIGVSPDTASRALKELQAAGFLECRVRRGFNNKRLASEYRLTVYPCDVTGRAAT
jgi:DNA-binding GntR family transcriptional regulator